MFLHGTLLAIDFSIRSRQDFIKTQISIIKVFLEICKTRMQSSEMRNGRLLTVSQHALHGGCVYPSMYWAGGYLPRGCTYPGVTCWGCLLWGFAQCGVPAWGVCIPACIEVDTSPCGQTDTCENITFANFVCGR